MFLSAPKLNEIPGVALVAVLGVGAPPLLLPALFCAGLLNWKESFGASDAATADVVVLLVVGVGDNIDLGASAGLVDPNVPLAAGPGLPNMFVV